MCVPTLSWVSVGQRTLPGVGPLLCHSPGNRLRSSGLVVNVFTSETQLVLNLETSFDQSMITEFLMRLLSIAFPLP